MRPHQWWLWAPGSKLWALGWALALVAVTAACAGSNEAAADAASTRASAAPPAACALISATELSQIVGTELVADGEDATGTTACIFKPRGGGFGMVEVKVDWGGGDAAMAATGFLGRMEPGIASSLDGVGDRAAVVGPALWIKTGEDLVTLTFFGIDRAEDAPRRIIGLMRPRMGPTSQAVRQSASQPAAAAGTATDAPAGLPKEAQELLGGVLGMLSQQASSATRDSRESSAGDPRPSESRGASAPTPRPDEPTFRPAAGLAPRPIPLVKGLTLVSAVHERDRGDYEPTLVVGAVTADAIAVTFSASLPEGDDISVPRTVRLEDFKNARKVRTWFQEGDPEVFPATTAFGVSLAVFDDLKANRDAAFELYTSRGHALLDLVSSLLGGETDSAEWQRGTLRRVEPHTLAIPVLVNDEPVELPAIHARGMLGGELFDYYVLDDPKLPLVLRAAGGNVLQTVRIAFPVPAESPAAVLESRLKKDGRAEIYGLYFDFSKDTLRSESERVLDQIAEVLRNNPDWRLHVEGHTDNIGGDDYNLDLSRRRAAAVERALVDRYRIDADRLAPAGFGAARPKASNDTLSGRAQNRRVELVRQ